MGKSMNNTDINKNLYTSKFKNMIDINKKFFITWGLLTIFFSVILLDAFKQFVYVEMKTASVYSFIFYLISSEHINYFIFSLFSIVCMQSFVNLNAHSFLRITKYKNRSEYFKNIIENNALLSISYTLFIFIVFVLVGLVGGLSFNPDYNSDIASSVFNLYGNNDMINVVFVLMMMVAFFLYTFIIGLISVIIYFIRFKRVYATIGTMALLFFNMEFKHMGNLRIFMFKKNIYFSEWIVTTANGKVFCICFWLSQVIILVWLLEWIIERKNYILKKKNS